MMRFRLLFSLLLLGCSSHGQQLNNTSLDEKYPEGYEDDALPWSLDPGTPCQVSGMREVYCMLPRGGIGLRVEVDNIRLQCERSFSCKELSEVSANMTSYTHKDTLQTLTIDSCVLPDERLSCLLDLFNVTAVKHLILQNLMSDLKELHLEGLEMLTDFDIRKLESSIKRIPYDALATLPHLRRVMIQYAELDLADETDGAVLSVERLSLVDCKLKTIPNGAFRRMPHLNDLIVIGVHVRLNIEEGAFYDLPRLVNISLNMNNLSSLPEGVFSRNRQLQNIDMYSNELVALDASAFAGLPLLTEININSNRETLLLNGGVFSNLPSLKLVDMHDTQLSNVSADLFSNSTSLRRIDMSYCKVATLPDDLFSNLNLEHLDISSNDIDSLPSTLLRGQGRMKHLAVKDNNISVLPRDIFSSLSSLEVLNLNDNKIQYLDDFLFLSLGGLIKLYMDGNKLEKLSKVAFEPLHSLKVLSASKNNIVDYEVAVTNLKSLAYLDLSGNNITTVYDFIVPTTLLELNLSHNRIAELSRTNLDSRARVDLRYNQITYVDLMLVPGESPDSLPDLLLDYNPFNCSCPLYNFIALTSNKSYSRIHVDEATCATPAPMARRKLTALTVDMLTCDYSPCPEGCECLERVAERRYEFTCSSMPDWNQNARSLADIALRLDTYSPIDALPPSVKHLDLSGLNITSFEPSLSYPIEIDLSDNGLMAAPTLLRANFTLNLLNNPLQCDCEHRDSVTLMKEYNSNIQHYSQLTCENGDYVETKDIARICSLQGQLTYSILAIVLLFFLVVVTALVYKNIVFIRIALRKIGLNLPEDLGEYEFDGFVSFAQEDAPIVDDVVSRLESGPRPLRMCVHTRNWIPGEVIVEQIERSVDRSRWTVIVLSRNFVRSQWARVEYLTAHTKNRLLLLVIDDVHTAGALTPEIELYIKSTTYTHLSNPYAIEQLRDALLRRPKWPMLTRSRAKGQGERAKGALDVHVNVDGQLVNMAEAVKL